MPIRRAPLERREEIQKKKAAQHEKVKVDQERLEASKPRQQEFLPRLGPHEQSIPPSESTDKDGIPPAARWTKIDRRLVNPEALEFGKENFEVREGFVIVLRVLTRDEVQGYADATKRIRDGREEAFNKEGQNQQRENGDVRNKSLKASQVETRAPERPSASDLYTFGADLIDTEHEVSVLNRDSNEVPNSPSIPKVPFIVTGNSTRSHFSESATPFGALGTGLSFRPSIYKWDATEAWHTEPTVFQTSIFKNSHYNKAHYNNPNFQPEQWTPVQETAFQERYRSETLRHERHSAEEFLVEEEGAALLGNHRSDNRDDDKTLGRKGWGRAIPGVIEGEIKTRARSQERELCDSSQTRSRSRASSIASIADSVFSIISGSSMSSVTGPQSAVDRLVALLLDDTLIKSLCVDALATVERERFERNLRRLLKDFAIGLQKEAVIPRHRHAAQFVRVRARNSAHMICSNVESKKKSLKSDDIDFEFMSEESDEDVFDEEVDDLQDLEVFIKASQALVTLRRKLRDFVHNTSDFDKEENEDGEKGPRMASVRNHPAEEPSSNIGAEKEAEVNHKFISTFGRDGEDAIEMFHSRVKVAEMDARQISDRANRAKHAPDQRGHFGTAVPSTSGSVWEHIYESSRKTEYEFKGYGYMAAADLPDYGLNTYSGKRPPSRRYSVDSSKWPWLRHFPISALGSTTKDDFLVSYTQPLIVLAPKADMHNDFGCWFDDNVRQKVNDHAKKGEELSEDSIVKDESVALPKYPTKLSWLSMAKESVLALVSSAFIKQIPEPLEGWMRIEFKCKCGHKIADDVMELQRGAANRLQQRLSRYLQLHDASETTTFSSSRRAIAGLLQSLRGGLGLESSSKLASDLPMHEAYSANVAAASGNSQPHLPEMTPLDLIYLLICYNKGKYEERLLQLDLTKLAGETDRELFQILRQSYYNLKTGLARFLSLRSLHSIQFVQFEMYKSELVDIKRKDTLPPPEDIDYRYTPAPPETIPPIGTNYLMHIFQHPDCAEDEPLCLSRFPKKLKEKLLCKGGIKPGWGLQFIEGWDGKKLWLVGFLFFGLGSLTIGVLWAVLEKSIQDAFAIAAYVVAFGTMSVGTIQALLVM